jgi:sugar phosphate isomerase/epimerase
VSASLNEPSFGVDLISFYHPAFWEVATRQDLVDRSAADPRWFWDRALESVRAAGIDGVEVCFPPGTWQSAVAAYGSEKGFVDALAAQELGLISGFFDALEEKGDVLDESAQRDILRSGAEYARFLAQCGGHVLVAGMPVLERGGAGAETFLDLEYAKRVADLLNRLGAVARREGVKMAMHTEMGSVFCARRDIDLFLLLTDPEFVDFCPDTGHITLGGSNPVDVLNDHYDRVVIMHWKDATGPFDMVVPPGENRHAYYQRYFKQVGTGAVDWRTWARRLHEINYQGWMILELDESPDPITEMTAAREFAERVLKSEPAK